MHDDGKAKWLGTLYCLVVLQQSGVQEVDQFAPAISAIASLSQGAAETQFTQSTTALESPEGLLNRCGRRLANGSFRRA